MTRTHYPLWYRLDQVDSYVIWFSNDVDGVVAQDNGTVPSFRELDALHAYARNHHLALPEEEPVLYNLDTLAR